MSPKAVFLLVVLGIVAFVANQSLFVVQEGETAIVLRLGAIQGEEGAHEYSPGLHFKTPFVTEALKFDRRRQVSDSDRKVPVLTNEKKNVTVDHFVVWRLGDAKSFYESAQGGDFGYANSLIDKFTYDAIQQTFSKRGLVEVISQRGGVVSVDAQEEISLTADFNYQRDCVEELDETARDRQVSEPVAAADASSTVKIDGEEVDQTILDEIASIVRSRAQKIGVEVVDVRVKSLELDRALNVSIFDRMRSERLKVKNLLEACGQKEFTDIVSDAKSQATQKVAKAQREAAELIAKGRANAARTYSEAYTRNGEFYAFYRRLEAYKKSLATGNLIITRPDDDFFKYLQDPYGGKAPPKMVRKVRPADPPAEKPVVEPAAKPVVAPEAKPAAEQPAPPAAPVAPAAEPAPAQP